LSWQIKSIDQTAGGWQSRNGFMTLWGAFMARTVFVAETDDHGAVAWVWRFGPSDRIAHPVARGTRNIGDPEDCEFHGASQNDIVDWLHRKQAL
jgi:hypothetical protein